MNSSVNQHREIKGDIRALIWIFYVQIRVSDTILNLLVSNCAVGLDLLERMSGLTFVLAGVGGVGLSRLINCDGRGGCRDNTTSSMLSSS